MEEYKTIFNKILVAIQQVPFGDEFIALGIFLFFLLLRTLFAGIVIRLADNLAKRTKNTIDDELVEAIKEPTKFLFIVIGLSLSINYLDIPDKWDTIRQPFISGLYTFTLFWALFCAVTPITHAVFSMGNKLGRKVNEDLRYFCIHTLEVVVFLIGAVSILEQWHVNVSAFLGGLGLAGMAVALAAKDTVANLFGTLTIFTDKTFKKGDWIQTPDIEGTVEVIGLRASKIRTFAKALVNMPNAKLADSPIINWSRMTNRRIKMRLGLEYRTTGDQLERIVARLRDFIANDPKVELKIHTPQMVHVGEFGPSSIDIDLYYFTKTTDWEEWRQIQNDHIIAFKKIVEEEGSSFAFPSRTIYVENGTSDLAAGAID